MRNYLEIECDERDLLKFAVRDLTNFRAEYKKETQLMISVQ